MKKTLKVVLAGAASLGVVLAIIKGIKTFKARKAEKELKELSDAMNESENKLTEDDFDEKDIEQVLRELLS